MPEAKLPPTLDFPMTGVNHLLWCFSFVVILLLATDRDLTNAGVTKDKIKK